MRAEVKLGRLGKKEIEYTCVFICFVRAPTFRRFFSPPLLAPSSPCLLGAFLFLARVSWPFCDENVRSPAITGIQLKRFLP